MPTTPADSLKSFYDGITDRRQVAEQIKWEKENEPAFAGMTESQIGKAINHITGAAPGSAFERFDSKTSWIDAAGYYSRELFTGAPTTPSNYMAQMRGEATNNWGDVGAELGGIAGGIAGAKGTDLDYWKETGRGLPAGLGALALAALPGGIVATGAVTYGGAVDEAKAQGATGGQAAAVGAIDTAVNLLFLKASRPLSDMASGSLLGKTMGIGARDALIESSGLVTKEGAKIGGRALTELAVKEGAITTAQGFTNRLLSEGFTEAVQSAAGVAGQIAHEGILDFEGLKQNMLNPHYWASTLAAEGVYAVMGTAIGSRRDPNALADYSVIEAGITPLFQASGGNLEDLQLPGAIKAEAVTKSTADLKEGLLAKTGPDAVAPLAADSSSAIKTVADALVAADKVGINENAAQAAASLIDNGNSSLVESLLNEALVTTQYDRPILDSSVKNFRVAHNRVELDVDGLAEPMVITAENLHTGREVFVNSFTDPKAQLAASQMWDHYDQRLQAELTDFAPSFPDYIPAEKKLGYFGFLESSGLGEAATNAKVKIKFVDSRKSTDWFDTFATLPNASANFVETSAGTIIHVNAVSDSRLTDIHEIGHVMDYVLEAGGYGDDFKNEWFKLKTTWAPEIAKGNNLLSATVGLELTKETGVEKLGTIPITDVLPSDYGTYYKSTREWAAQAFQSYMTDKPTKFREFMTTHFPKLNELFDRVVKSLRTTISKSKGDVSKADKTKAWAPGTHEAKVFFESLMNSVEASSTDNEFRKLVAKHKLPAKAVESALQTLTEGRTLAAKPMVFEAINLWAKDPTRNEQDLLTGLELVNLVNKSKMPYADLMSPTATGLPNVRRLMQIDTAAVKGDMLVKLEGADDATRARVEEYVKAMEAWDTGRALQAVDAILSNKVKQVELEVSQESLAEKAMLMLRMDSVLGKWFRGELPGQEGRFMWEPRATEKGAWGIKQRDDKDIHGPVELREANEILLSKQFPTLSKAIKGIKTSSKEEGMVLDVKSDKPGKARIFPDKQTADEYADAQNANGGNYGYSYAALPYMKSKKGGAKGEKELAGYTVRYRKDGRKTIVAGLREDLVNTIDALHSLNDDPDTKNYVTENAMSLLAKNYNDGIEHHIIRVTKRMFADFRNGKREVFPAQMQQALKDFYKYIGSDRRTYYAALVKELNVPSLALEDVLLGLVRRGQTSIRDKNDLILHMDPPVKNLVENYKNYLKVWLENDFNANMQHTLAGGVPYVHNDRKVWRNFEEGMSPLMDHNFQQQMEVMQHAMPGGILRKNAAGISYVGMSPRSLVGKVASGVEQIFFSTYGGAQSIGESIPVLKPLAKFIDRENPNQDYMGNRILRNLRGEMEKVTMPDGEERLVPKEGSEKKDDRVHIAINGSKKLKPIANRIKLMENEAGGIKFKDIQANNLQVGLGSGQTPKPEDVARRAELAKEADELIQKNFDTNNPKHQQEFKDLTEFLERSYAAQRETAQIAFEQELKLHHATTAYSLFKGNDFTGTPEQAEAFAGRMQSIDFSSPNGQLELYRILTNPTDQGGLGWDQVRAGSFQNAWIAGIMEIKNLRDMMLSTPGYTKEQRLRRWHVSGVEQNPKNGAVGTGLWDFDTQEEAVQFIKDAPSMGIKVSDKNPRDQYEKNSKMRSGTDMLSDVVSRVANTRQALLEMVLSDHVQKGQMTQDEANNIVKVLSGMSEDITSDMGTNRLQNIIGGHRLFKAGRDQLDMSFQQEESSWRMAIQYARKQTDAGFQLYLDDPRLAPYPKERDRMRTAKDALRTADGKGQRIASKTAFSYFLLGNISSAMIEAAQWPLSLSHILVEEGAGILQAFRTPGAKSAKAARASAKRLLTGNDADIWDGEEAALIHYAEQSNRLGVRPLNDISTDSVEVKIANARAAANPGAYQGFAPKAAYYAQAAYQALNHFYAFFSRINAEISLTSSYEVLKKTKYPNRKPNAAEQMELFEDAIRVSNKANGSWGRGNRPWWFDTKSTTGRTAAQLAWSLQGFASNHIANHLRLVKHAINAPELGRTKEQTTQSRKALALMTTMQVAGLGVMGHTLAGGISKLLIATFGYDPESEIKEWLEDTVPMDPEDQLALSDLVSYGGLHASGMPMDLRSRLSVSGLGPLSSYEGFNAAGFGGPVLSTIGSLVDGWNTVSKGDGSVESFMRWGTGMAPTGVQRLMRQELFDDGKVFNKSGQFIMDPTTGEKIAAYLGFAPQRYTDYMRAKTKSIEANEADGRESSRATKAIYSLLNDGQHGEAMNMLTSEAKRLGKTPKELADMVAQHSIVQTHGPAELTGRGPNAQRAARLYQSPLPEATEVAKVQTKFSTLAKLNQLPLDWQRGMFDAKLNDTAKVLTGGNGISARNELRNPLFKSTVLSVLQQESSQTMGGLGQLSSGFYR